MAKGRLKPYMVTVVELVPGEDGDMVNSFSYGFNDLLAAVKAIEDMALNSPVLISVSITYTQGYRVDK